MAKNRTKNNRLRTIFLLYCAVMLWLLFFRSSGWVPGQDYQTQLRANINLTPFYTIGNYLRVILERTNDAVLLHCVINLAGNVILFFPAGVMIPMLWPKTRNFFRFFILCAGVMFFVEVLQLFTLLGSFDVDDLILNLLGMTLGFIDFHLFQKRK